MKKIILSLLIISGLSAGDLHLLSTYFKESRKSQESASMFLKSGDIRMYCFERKSSQYWLIKAIVEDDNEDRKNRMKSLLDDINESIKNCKDGGY